jgi:hypothetical protein
MFIVHQLWLVVSLMDNVCVFNMSNHVLKYYACFGMYILMCRVVTVSILISCVDEKWFTKIVIICCFWWDTGFNQVMFVIMLVENKC